MIPEVNWLARLAEMACCWFREKSLLWYIWYSNQRGHFGPPHTCTCTHTTYKHALKLHTHTHTPENRIPHGLSEPDFCHNTSLKFQLSYLILSACWPLEKGSIPSCFMFFKDQTPYSTPTLPCRQSSCDQTLPVPEAKPWNFTSYFLPSRLRLLSQDLWVVL